MRHQILNKAVFLGYLPTWSPFNDKAQCNIKRFYVPYPQWIFILGTDLKTNSEYCPANYWLAFITETECVYCGIRTESLYTTPIGTSF